MECLLFSSFNLPTEIQAVRGGTVDDGVCDRGHGGSGRCPLNMLLDIIECYQAADLQDMCNSFVAYRLGCLWISLCISSPKSNSQWLVVVSFIVVLL